MCKNMGLLSDGEISQIIKVLSSGECCSKLEVVEPTNYDIAMEVFKEIAQDINQTPQDRMDACKLLLEYDC